MVCDFCVCARRRHSLCVCVQVLEAVRTATLRHTKQRRTCCPEPSALREVSRGRGGEPAVEFARGLADALRVVCHDGGRETGEVVRQVLLRRGTAEAVGGAVDDDASSLQTNTFLFQTSLGRKVLAAQLVHSNMNHFHCNLVKISLVRIRSRIFSLYLN